MNMNMDTRLLDAQAVDMARLSTNLPEIIGQDCTGAGYELASEVQNNFPLVTWLLNTSLSNRVRRMVYANGLNLVTKDATTNKYQIAVPASLNTVTPKADQAECCWAPMDFAKTEAQMPMNLLCLKDCENIADDLLGKALGFGSTVVDPFIQSGDTAADVKKRVARLSMAFYTAYTAILGLDDTYTDILKPFHGLMQIMEDSTIANIDASTDVLAAFDSLYCRIIALGINPSDVIIAVHPIIYNSVLSLIVPGQWNQLPFGWTRENDVIKFNGISFLQDKLVPVDEATGKGEAWVLTGDSVGLFLLGQLLPDGNFVRESGFTQDTPANGCGQACTYYFNMGTALANNTNRLAVISNIAVSTACTGALGLIKNDTLVPASK